MVLLSSAFFLHSSSSHIIFTRSVLWIITTLQISRVSSSTHIFVLDRWVTSFFALTLAICSSSTCKRPSDYSHYLLTHPSEPALIAFKIWRTQRALPQSLRSRSLAVISCTLLESGAIYSATMVALIITYLIQTNVQYILFFGVCDFAIYKGIH